MTKRMPRIAALAGVAAALGYFLLRARYYAAWMDDDAFISFRYARNLVRGAGLVYNVGEHVEGYSNFLWTILLAGAHALGAPLPETARLLGLALATATGLLLLHPSLRVLPRGIADTAAMPLLVALAPVALWATDSFAAWAVGGLENPLGALLVTAAFLFYFRSLDALDGVAGARRAGLCAALAALTHPSYALFGVVLGLHAVAVAARSRSFRVPIALAFPAIVLGAPYVAWKIGTYGHVLPNTFSAKVGFTSAVLSRGLRYLTGTARGLPIVAVAAVAALIWLLARRDRDPRPWLLLGGVLAYAGYVVGIGGESFPAFRVFVVVLPLSCLLLRYAVASLAAARAAFAVVAVVAVAVAVGLGAVNRATPRVRVLDAAIRVDALGCFRAVGLDLKRRLPRDTLLAHSGAGVISFYSELPFLDTLGLTDAHIAARPMSAFGKGAAGHEKGDGAYVLARRPHVVILSGHPVSSFSAFLPGDRELLALPTFARAYERRVMEVRFTPRGASAETTVPVPMFVRRDVAPF